MEIFNPHQEEIHELKERLKEAFAKQKYHDAGEIADRLYLLMFDTSLVYARVISDTKEMISEKKLEEMARIDHLSPEKIGEIKDIFNEFINSTTVNYQRIMGVVKEMDEFREKYRVTNAPTE